jgi:hypothetical protein
MIERKLRATRKLTLREEALIFYLKNRTPEMTFAQAAVLAGYSSKWPSQAASQALKGIAKKRPQIYDELGLTVAACLTLVEHKAS